MVTGSIVSATARKQCITVEGCDGGEVLTSWQTGSTKRQTGRDQGEI
jgi:hypothetical protein